MSKSSLSSSLSYVSKGGYETQDNKSSSNSVASPIPGDDDYLSLSFNFTNVEDKNVGASAPTLAKKKPSYAAVAASPPRKQCTVSSFKLSINSRRSIFPPISFSLNSLMGTKKNKSKTSSVATVTPAVAPNVTPKPSAIATKSRPKPKSADNVAPAVAPNVTPSKSKSAVTPASKSASKCNTHNKPKSIHMTSTSDSILDIWTRDPNEDPTATLNLERLPFAISKDQFGTTSNTSMIDSELAWPSSTPSPRNKDSL